MSRLILPNRFAQQPQYAAGIDRSNPLGTRVVYASTLGGIAYDAARGRLNTNTGAVPKVTARGVALNFNGTSSFITLPTTNLVSGYPLTVSCWFEKTTSVSQVIYSLNGSGYSAIAGYTPANLNLSINVGSNPGTLGYPFASIPAGWNHLVVVHKSGSFTMYLNGVDVTAATTGSENWGQPAAGNHSIGQRLNGASSRWFNGGIQDFIVLSGEVTPAEAAQLYANPYQIFKAPSRRVWVDVGGGSATTLQADAAAQASASGSLATGIPLSGAATSTASATGALAGDVALSAAATATGTATGGLSTGIPLGAAATATATATGALGNLVVIVAPPDRGTLDLPNCSITPNGSTPQINIKNRYIGDANTTGARFTFGSVTGVNGLTPVFKVDRSNMEINASSKFLWSTTGLKGSWQAFDNSTSDASFYTFSNNAAFTSDTIYFASNNPWPIGYTLPWITSLVASGFVSPAPSGSGSYQFGTRTATTDGATAGAGNVIAAQPLYAFKISSGAGNAPDGKPKRSVVLMSGTHAAEDVGNYALEGAVAFLVSADSQAVTARDWFNFYVYPVTATAGRAGGGQRNDFENTLKTTDVNREWPNNNLETVVKHKAAIDTDTGGVLAMLFDFHGTHLSNEGAYDWYNGLNQATWTAAVRTYWAGLEIRSNGTNGLASKWSVDSKSARHGVSPEYPYHNNEVMASLLSYGESHMRAVAHLAAAGEFVGLTGTATSTASGTADLTTNAGSLSAAALSIASASGELTTAIPLTGSAVSVSTASGALTAQIKLSAAALAQAVSSAALSSGIILTASAVSQAAAQGTLASAIQMIASAAAQATASASLTAGGGLSANAAAQATASAALTVQIQIAASALAQAAASASLTTGGGMSANALAAANANGLLTTQIPLTAAALAQAIASGGLTASINLSASALSSASASAVLAGPAAPVSSVSIISAPAHRHHQPGVLYGRRHGIRIAP